MTNLPSDTVTEKPRRKFGCFKVFLLLLVLLAVALHFTISGIAKNVANRQLPIQLQTEAELGGIDISLLLGRVGLRNLQIAQPEGFGESSLLNLEKLVVVVPPGKAIGRDPLEIRSVHLSGMELNLIQDTNQILNLSRLGPPPTEEPEVIQESAAEALPVWLKHLLLEEVAFRFEDLTNEWQFNISDLSLELENIQVDYDSGKGPGLIRADLVFPDGRENGRLKLIAKIGRIHPTRPEQAPPLQLALGVIGFDLGLLDPFLEPSPTAAKTAFGGSAFDFLVFFTLHPGDNPAAQEINGSFEITTNRNHRIADNLGGTLEEPVLPFTSLFINILGNQIGRITNLGGNMAKGSLEAGKAVTDTGVAAVKGAGKTVTGFAGGVLRTAKGVATLDKEDTFGGIKDATVGTAGNLTGTVTDTAGTAARGVGSTAGTLTGQAATDLWWSRVDERMLAFETAANQWFEENPFPGTEM